MISLLITVVCFLNFCQSMAAGEFDAAGGWLCATLGWLAVLGKEQSGWRA